MAISSFRYRKSRNAASFCHARRGVGNDHHAAAGMVKYRSKSTRLVRATNVRKSRASWGELAPPRSGDFVAEANRALLDALEHDREAAAAQHPFEAMVAVLSAKQARSDDRGEVRQYLHDFARGLVAGGNAWALIRTGEPRGKGASRLRRVAMCGRGVDM